MCDAGTYAVNNDTANQQCLTCPPGFYCQGGISTPCPANSYCVEGTSTPAACPALSTAPLYSNASTACECGNGYYMSGGVCLRCGFGTYGAKGTVGACNVCPANSTTASQGAYQLSQCLCVPGFTGDALAQVNSVACSVCPADAYCPGNKANHTLVCPNATFSTKGSSSQDQCVCPVNAAWLPNSNCTCKNGFFSAPPPAPICGFICGDGKQCPYTVTAGSEMGSYPLSNSMGTVPCSGLITNAQPWTAVVDLGETYSNVLIDFMYGQYSSCPGCCYERTKTMKLSIGPSPANTVLCYTAPSNLGADGMAPTQFTNVTSCNGLSGRYLQISSDQAVHFAIGKLIIREAQCKDTRNPRHFLCYTCKAGSYCQNGSAFPCPANSFCPADTITPVACPALSTSVENSSAFSACLCNAGYAMIGGVCTQCDFGTYGVRGSVGACSVCPANSNTSAKGTQNLSSCYCKAGYTGEATLDPACSVCPANSYCPGGKANHVIQCPNATFAYAGAAAVGQCICPAGTAWLPGYDCTCLNGTYKVTVATTLAPWQCADCVAGTFCQFGDALECPEGAFCAALSSSPVVCPIGSFCAAGASAATPCPANSNTTAPGAKAASQCLCNPGYTTDGEGGCEVCPANSYCAGKGIPDEPCPENLYSLPGASALAQCVCPASSAWNGSACVCAAGLLQISNPTQPIGGWECSACPENSVCVNGVKATCGEGFYCVGGIPIQCPANNFCLAGASAPQPCAADSYALPGSAICTCSPGYMMLNYQCARCQANTFCLNNVQNACPAQSVSPAGSSSLAACLCIPGYYGSENACAQCVPGSYCIGGSVTGPRAMSICPAGKYCPAGADAPLTCNTSTTCPANSSAPTPCPAGFYCPTPWSTATVCPPGGYCPTSSVGRVSCPTETFSTLTRQTNVSACTRCTVCPIGQTQKTACTPTTDRVCNTCSGAPAQASYFASSAACSWMCNPGYAGPTCAACPAGSWCSNGIANRCPVQSSSIAGASVQSQCTCSPGFSSQLVSGLVTCTACVAGTICSGGGAIQTQVSTTPVAGAASQVMLVQQPLPVASNLVSLVTSIPTQLAAMAVKLNVASIYSRQVCRGSYCIACDGSAACVPKMWIGVGQASKFTFNVTSIPTDTLVFVVKTNALFCTPKIELGSEYVTGNTFILTSISTITSVTFSCPTNTERANSLSVQGTTRSAARRLLSMERRLTQTTLENDILGVSLVVPTEEANATQQLVEAANLTVQGFATVPAVEENVTLAEVRCPDNSTSPVGATRLSQCYCLPGYKGNASMGTPCEPCDLGQYCSGGIMGLCPTHSAAPPLSNSSNDCVCDLGFYGPSTSCQQCPANSYCMGGRRQNCTANAVSAPQGSSPQSCFCRAGFSGVNNQPCQPCRPGFWCSGGMSNACPMNWTSNANSSQPSDCFCADGFQSVSTRDSSGNAISICQACSGSTYCKVPPSQIPIYNTPSLDSPACER